MSNALFPEDLRQFVLMHIDSVAHLEGLLLLRSDPDAVWSVPELAKRLYTSEKQTSKLLLRLYSDGFLMMTSDKPPMYLYRPCSTKLREMIDRVADIYPKYLVPVTNLIHSKPAYRVQEFEDAFELEKAE